jgi:hypothetical protein
MMATLKQPAFLLLVVLFGVHQVLQKFYGIHLGWLSYYIDPLLGMPILLTLLLAERRYLLKKGKAYQFSALEVGVAVAALSFIFEILFPVLSDRFTADWRDGIAYAVGGAIFYYFLNGKLADANLNR